MDDPVKILIVDDSATYRNILTRVVEQIPNAECVGMAANGKIAVRKADELLPDLLLLDVMMPEMDGVETLRLVKQAHPRIEAIMISGVDMANAKATIESLEIGAMDFIAKPTVSSVQEGIDLLVRQLTPLVRTLQIKKYTLLSREKIQSSIPQRDLRPPIPEKPPAFFSRVRGKIQWILIGISTGGPNALQKLIPSIELENAPPVIIIQHMPPMFTESLAERLRNVSHKPVKEAQDGESPQPGQIYIIPGGFHMLLKKDGSRYYFELNDGPRVQNCKPSVNVFFESAAKVLDGKEVLSVVMTGMGRDGTDGVRALKEKGALCLIQDEASSVVWGMPGSVHEAGLDDEIISLDRLGTRISEIVKTS